MKESSSSARDGHRIVDVFSSESPVVGERSLLFFSSVRLLYFNALGTLCVELGSFRRLLGEHRETNTGE